MSMAINGTPISHSQAFFVSHEFVLQISVYRVLQIS